MACYLSSVKPASRRSAELAPPYKHAGEHQHVEHAVGDDGREQPTGRLPHQREQQAQQRVNRCTSTRRRQAGYATPTGEAIVLKEFYWMTKKMTEAQRRGKIEKRTHWVGFEE